MEYKFLVDTYDTERFKTLNVWSMFKDDDLLIRPHKEDKRARNLLEHMIHQCAGENKWFCKMFGIDVGAPPLPSKETRLEFIKRYAEDSGKRLAALKEKDKAWWEGETGFFNTIKPRTWIMTRRIAHTAHHRGEQVTMLRILGRNVYSVYGPSADTGGLPDNNVQTIYAYPDLESSLTVNQKAGQNPIYLVPEISHARNGLKYKNAVKAKKTARLIIFAVKNINKNFSAIKNKYTCKSIPKRNKIKLSWI